MSKSGFLKLPRSFYDNPIWQSFSLEYRSIFLTILINCAWKDTIQDDHGEPVLVKAGQCLMTERQIVDESFPPTKDPKILEKNKATCHRALNKFEKLHFSYHKTYHRKLLHTIVQEDLLQCFIPDFEPKTYQARTIKEEDQNKRIDDLDLIDLENPNDDCEILEFQHKKLGTIKSSIDQVFEILKKDGWNEKEINLAVLKMKKQNPLLNGKIESYLTTILKNKKREKVLCKSSQPKTKTGKSQSANDYFLGSDLSEAPLAKYARLNGLNN